MKKIRKHSSESGGKVIWSLSIFSAFFIFIPKMSGWRMGKGYKLSLFCGLDK